MDNKEFGKKLEDRTKLLSIEIIRLSIQLPKIAEANVIRNQLTKAGTSIGANYREANRSRSKADFINKIKISESESNETLYWLEIIKELEWVESEKLNALIKEVNEILAIFTSAGSKIKTTIK